MLTLMSLHTKAGSRGISFSSVDLERSLPFCGGDCCCVTGDVSLFASDIFLCVYWLKIKIKRNENKI